MDALPPVAAPGPDLDATIPAGHCLIAHRAATERCGALVNSVMKLILFEWILLLILSCVKSETASLGEEKNAK
jgi:hypothetical protein